MMRIVLLGKRASARPISGQKFGAAVAPASAASSVRRDVKQRAIEVPPESVSFGLPQLYQGVGPAAPGTGRPSACDDHNRDLRAAVPALRASTASPANSACIDAPS